MSTPNFRTMDGFPLWVTGDERFMSKRCPDCGMWNSADAEQCDDCGADLTDVEAEYDPGEAMFFYDEMEDALRDVNSGLKFHEISVISGHYAGAQFFVKLNSYAEQCGLEYPDEVENDDAQYYFGCCRSKLLRDYEREQRKICRLLKKIGTENGFEEIVCVGIFSNGEAVYRRAAV